MFPAQRCASDIRSLITLDLFIFVTSYLVPIYSLNSNELFSFGHSAGDARLTTKNDTVGIIPPFEIHFNDQTFQRVYLNPRGTISFRNDTFPRNVLSENQSGKNLSSLNLLSVDIDVLVSGSVWFRQTQELHILHEINRQISRSKSKICLSEKEDFDASWAFIATWQGRVVSRTSGMNIRKRSILQCVIVVDRTRMKSVVILNYGKMTSAGMSRGGTGDGGPLDTGPVEQFSRKDKDLGIRGKGSEEGRPTGSTGGDWINDQNVQSRDILSYMTGYSSDDVTSRSRKSNVGVPGEWMFRVDSLRRCEDLMSRRRDVIPKVVEEVPRQALSRRKRYGGCPFREDVHDRTRYRQNVPGHGWMSRPCAPGTVFSPGSCICGHDTRLKPTFTVPPAARSAPGCPFRKDVHDRTRYLENVPGHGWMSRPCAPGTVFSPGACPCGHDTGSELSQRKVLDRSSTRTHGAASLSGCPFREDLHDRTRYRQNVPGHGWMSRPCAPGTVFSPGSCICGHDTRLTPTSTVPPRGGPAPACPLRPNPATANGFLQQHPSGRWLAMPCPSDLIFDLVSCVCVFDTHIEEGSGTGEPVLIIVKKSLDTTTKTCSDESCQDVCDNPQAYCHRENICLC